MLETYLRVGHVQGRYGHKGAHKINTSVLTSNIGRPNISILIWRARLPLGPTRIKNWYHSQFQLILATFGLLIPKLSSDKSESGGKRILVFHWLKILFLLRYSQWETSIYFPPLSDLSEHSFGISRPNVARISWNFEWYQFFILVGPGGNRDCLINGRMGRWSQVRKSNRHKRI